MKYYKDPANSIKPEALSKRGGAHYSLAALMLIEAIIFNKANTQILNVKNQSLLNGQAMLNH